LKGLAAEADKIEELTIAMALEYLLEYVKAQG